MIKIDSSRPTERHIIFSSSSSEKIIVVSIYNIIQKGFVFRLKDANSAEQEWAAKNQKAITNEQMQEFIANIFKVEKWEGEKGKFV